MADSGGDVLRIGAQFDVSGLQSGFAQGAAVVSSSTAQMAGEFDTLKAKSAEAEVAIGESMRGSGREAMEARHAIHGLGEEIGIHVPRFVQNYITSLGGVAPVLASAFSAIAIVGILEILGEIPDVIDKIIGKFTGWTDAAKKAYDQAVSGNLKVISENLKLADEMDKTKEVGTTGTQRIAIEQANLATAIQRSGRQASELQRQWSSMNSDVESLEKNTKGWRDVLLDPFNAPSALKSWLDGTDKQIETAKTHADEFKKTIEDLNHAVTYEDKPKAAQLSAEAIAEATEQAQRLAAVRIQGEEDFNRIKAEGMAQEAAFHAKMAGGGYISPDQEAALEAQKENAVYGAQMDGLERRLALAKSEGEKGVQEAAEIATRIEALEATHQNKLDAITQTAALKDEEIQNKEAMSMRDQFAAYEAKELEDRMKAAADSVKLIEDQGRNELEQIRANAQEQEKAIAGSSAYKGADPRIAGVAKGAYDEEAGEIQKLIQAEQQLQAVLEANNVLKSNPTFQESLQREAELQNQLTQATKSYQMTVIEVAKAQQEAFMQGFSRITGSFNSNLVQWINGSERFGQLAQRAWTNLADTAINSLLKMGERFIQQQIIQRTQSQITAASQSASAAQGAAIVQASAMKQQFAYAKSAAGGAYNAMVNIPVIGPELGAVAAATTFAAIMAFDQGGIMPRDDIAMLHKDEMVLPPHISQSVQKMADGEGGGGSGHTFNYAPTVNGSLDGLTKEMLDKHGKQFVDYATKQLRRRHV